MDILGRGWRWAAYGASVAVAVAYAAVSLY